MFLAGYISLASLSLCIQGIERLLQTLFRRFTGICSLCILNHPFCIEAKEPWAGPFGSRYLSGNGCERCIFLAIHPEALFKNIDLIRSSIPLPHQGYTLF